LEKLLGSDDRYVRFNAYKALAKIGMNERKNGFAAITEVKDPNGKGVVAASHGIFKKYQEIMISLYTRITGHNRA
jgi:hypothetical protein